MHDDHDDDDLIESILDLRAWEVLVLIAAPILAVVFFVSRCL